MKDGGTPYPGLARSLTVLSFKFSPKQGITKPFGFYVACTPIWELPATFVYCCPVTILEWDSGHVIILTPVSRLGSLIIHCSIPPRI